MIITLWLVHVNDELEREGDHVSTYSIATTISPTLIPRAWPLFQTLPEP